MNAKAVIPVLIGLTVTSVSAAYMLYLFLKKDEDVLNPPWRIATSRQTMIEVKIPKECVGVVIGRGGSSIKSIQEKTDTKIIFKDDVETDQHRGCVIRGSPEGAQLAEALIHDIISNQPLIETHEIFVPQQACGRIIGRNGENIRGISRASNTKITVESSSTRDINATRRVTIKGSIEQIEIAKSLIEEKVVEDVEMRGKIHDSLGKRSPRKKFNPQYLMSAEAVDDEQATHHNTETLVATGKDGFLEVYVSAVEHPGQFWVQVIGPRAVELDHLVEEMTEYYKQDVNRELHVIKEITVEQLVAAPFTQDNKWYRARVTKVTLDDYDAEESDVGLYFLDYGDSDICKKKELFSLRTDFLKLRYQAIECSLAKVKPHGDSWTDEAIYLLDDLSHVGQWKVLMARVDSYKERERGEREGSPIPAVELYDTSGAQDINMAEELVKQGHAVWEKSEIPQQATGKQVPSGAAVKKIYVEDRDTSGGRSNTIGGTSGGEVKNNATKSEASKQFIAYERQEFDSDGGDDGFEMG